jgi:hypothetical protein
MSIKAMTWARDQRVGGGTTKLVLMLLGDYADDDGHCWPGIETIADKAEVDEKTVRRHLTKLVKMGKVARERRRHSDGTLGSYDFYLQMEAGAASSDTVAPVGRLSAGAEEPPESGSTTGETPEAAPPPEEHTSDTDAPVGRLSAGESGDEGPSTGQSVPDHRTSSYKTTGQIARTEPSVEQPVRPPPAAAGAPVSEVAEFLGENHRLALEAMRELPGWSPRVEETFLRRFVTGPMGELLMKGVPEEYRPAVIAECIWQYVEPEEGEPPARWRGSKFAGWLRAAAGQARKSVSTAAVASTVGDPDDDGAQELEGGGLLLPDGRRLTAAQARAYRRQRERMRSRRSA